MKTTPKAFTSTPSSPRVFVGDIGRFFIPRTTTLRGDERGVKGFTLIELLVVVLIIGILSAVALPQYERAVVKSRVATILPVLKSIKDAQEVYYMENGEYTENVEKLGIMLPANCSAITGGDGGLYKCGDSFILDLDYNSRSNGKVIANYCPSAADSWDSCTAVRNFNIRLYYAHNINNGISDKLVCLPFTETGIKMCKTFGIPYVGGMDCGANVGCTEL